MCWTADSPFLCVRSRTSLGTQNDSYSYSLCLKSKHSIKSKIRKLLYFPIFALEPSSTSKEIWSWNQGRGGITACHSFIPIWGRRKRKTEIEINFANLEQSKFKASSLFSSHCSRGLGSRIGSLPGQKLLGTKREGKSQG